MRPNTIATTIAVMALLAGGAARADQEVSVRVSTQLLAGDSGIFAASSGSALAEGEFGYSHTVTRSRAGKLWIEGNFMIGQRGGTTFGWKTALLVQQITAGARYTFALPRVPWLVPQLRIGAGLALASFGLQTTTEDTSDWAAGFNGFALGGLEFLLPRAWMRDPRAHGVTAGIVVEGGYAYTSPLAFTLAPKRSSDTVSTPLSGARTGSMDLTGPLIRAGLLLRF